MLKFDGKSTLIGFKFERLPKFCYHCGVIRHGVEGCLKRSMMRKQEVIQFGPWLRANSSTRRMEKTQTHERMVGNTDLASFSHLALGGETRRDGHQNKRGHGWKRRTANTVDDKLNKDFSKEESHRKSCMVSLDFRARIVVIIMRLSKTSLCKLRKEVTWGA
jgi:hypothetical protein